ncbi:MAG: hypothetical protein CMA08_00815 [Euryarchaeota archaeon]|nr:hypothetical protein [Euryarchaeota archaeon]
MGEPGRLAMVIALLMVPLLVHTAPYVYGNPEEPDRVIPSPESHEPISEGVLLILLDGVGEAVMLDEALMPKLHARLGDSAVLSLTTGPITLSATATSEMMTGVPNAPVDGFRNFRLSHPGGTDPWLSAADDPRHSVGMIGSYVMGNLYDSSSNVEFVNTFGGNGDYYEGDAETTRLGLAWMEEGRHNVMALHYSGTDKVGHHWGIETETYQEKLRHVDGQVDDVLEALPEGWTAIVTADHGMTSTGSHGSSEAVTREVAAVLLGEGVREGAKSEGHQRDLAALLPALLDLPFPAQLHGRIPLEALALLPTEAERLEAWNWEAAVERAEFHGFDDGGQPLNASVIEWSRVEVDEGLNRSSDVALSAFTWVLLLGLASRWAHRRHGGGALAMLVGGAGLAVLLSAQASLGWSAMVPRGLGAVAAAALTRMALSSDAAFEEHHERADRREGAGLVALMVVMAPFADASQVLMVACMGCVLLLASRAALDRPLASWVQTKPAVAVVLVLLAASYGSLRVWFVLPVLLGWGFGRAWERFRGVRRDLSLGWALGVGLLACFGVLLPHRRILESNVLLDLVRLDPTGDAARFAFSLVLLAVTAAVWTMHVHERLSLRSSGIMFGLLVLVLGVRSARSNVVDWLALAGLLAVYITAMRDSLDTASGRLPNGVFEAALTAHLLLIWGPWAALSSLSVLALAPRIMQAIGHRPSTGHQWVAYAVLPWMLVATWWTLLGQVDGVQTCHEGLCPYPRELDPGTVVLNGGYVGARNNPADLWIGAMVVTPLVMLIGAVCWSLARAGLDLRPYVTLQALLIVGCLATLAFAPAYPRLVFSLSYNALFAALQVSVAAAAFALTLRQHDRGQGKAMA